MVRRKPFTCVDFLQQSQLDNGQVQVLHVELPPPDICHDPWVRERASRDALAVGLRLFPKDTYFMVSDIDEYPDPKIYPELKKQLHEHESAVIKLSMSFHYGRADLQVCDPDATPKGWTSCMFSQVKRIEEYGTISELWKTEDYHKFGDQDAGWHFSWMGNKDMRLSKLRAFSHQELNTPAVNEICEEFSGACWRN